MTNNTEDAERQFRLISLNERHPPQEKSGDSPLREAEIYGYRSFGIPAVGCRACFNDPRIFTQRLGSA